MVKLSRWQLTFVKNERLWWSYQLLKSYKRFSKKLNNKWFPGLIAKVIAYDEAVKATIAKKKKEIWKEDFKEELKKGKKTLDDILRLEIKPQLNPDTKYNPPKTKTNLSAEVEKELNKKNELFYILKQPRKYENYAENGDKGNLYKEDLIEKSFLEETEKEIPSYSDYRKQQAKKLIKEYGLKIKIVSEIQNLAFKEILKIVGNKKKVSPEESETIKFLEVDGIEYAFKIFLHDLGCRTTDIKTLRNENKKMLVNTVCWRCGKTLLRLDSPFKKSKLPENYCKQRENRSCSDMRNRENRKFIYEAKIGFSKRGKCDKCKRSGCTIIHKMQGKDYLFCSKKCYQNFRKKNYNVSKTQESSS